MDMSLQMETPDCVGAQPGGTTGVGAQSTGSTLADPVDQGCRFPPPGTCEAVLLRRLLLGEAVSQQTFFKEAWSWRLAAYIHRLRRRGWAIVTTRISARNKYEAVSYGQYTLDVVLDHDMYTFLSREEPSQVADY